MTGIQHLLSVADLDADGIAEVLRVAEAFAEVERRSVPKVPTLRGKVVATLFFEESTRTRLSFETAAKRLSADVLNLAVPLVRRELRLAQAWLQRELSQ